MFIDSFIDNANQKIVRSAEETSISEAPWDGFGGLVLTGDSAAFREEGLFTAYAPLHRSSSMESSRPRSSPASQLGKQSLADTPKSVDRPRLPDQTQAAIKDRPNVAQRPILAPQIPEDRNVAHPVSKASSEKSSRGVQPGKMVDRNTSEIDRFKSRLIAVRSEGISAKETMLKCAAIAADAFGLAIKKLQGEDFVNAYLLAEVAESACPESTSAARNKISKLKQYAIERLKKSVDSMQN